MNRQPTEMEKIFVNYVLDKGIIYKEQNKSKRRKKPNNSIKNMQRITRDYYK